MKSFNILDRQQPVHRHAILEASAGTGKTFAIENLVVRLLIETQTDREPLSLNRILVVTFTKAATRDLKVRIRAKLDKALRIIKGFMLGDVGEEDIPDYLLMHIEKGDEALLHARQRIEAALFSFDQAQIFTIHGFCWRMLQIFAIEGGISLASACSEEQTLAKTKLLQVVRDFMRTELVPESYSSHQIARVLQMYGGEPEKLQADLLQVVMGGVDISAAGSFSEDAAQFFAAMKNLQLEWNFESEKIIADFRRHVPAYRGICNRSKQVHPSIMTGITNFAQLFDKASWTTADFDLLLRDGLMLLEVLSPAQLSAKGVPPERKLLHYPDLLQILQKTLAPIINKARHPHSIFANMAKGCQKLLRYYQKQEEMLGFNDLLEQMQQAMQSPIFAAHVRDSFDAVIVDEFQDTDPVQWEIFRELFAQPNWKGHLYLVGDPKQSIYAFRQADIYTYLSAADVLGSAALATLDTNFRSQPALVEALNVLFESTAELFPLPRQQRHLPYRRVKAGKLEEQIFADQAACVQFLLATPPLENKKKITLQEYEELYFFPAMVKEIIRLHTQDNMAFSRCAVLVADRFQAERLLAFFSQAGIPAVSQRGVNLAESVAVHALRELLQGILHYRQSSKYKVALAGRLIGMTHSEILLLDQPEHREALLQQCEQLRRVLLADGFAGFYPQFLRSCWHRDDKSILQRLLEQQDGIIFYRECQDIAELLIQEQAKKNLSAESLIAFLDELEILAINDDERLKQAVDLEQDAVIVLTSHVSKGLEFEIVFALGLIKRSSHKEALMPVQRAKQLRLEAILDKQDADYLKHCEELDAEKMRQLYVALTRAKSRLYLPVAIGIGGNAVEIGAASPMELFLARLSMQSEAHGHIDYQALYAHIQTYEARLLCQFVEQCSANISVKILQKVEESIHYQQVHVAPRLSPPPQLMLEMAPLFVQSFTSLAQAKPRVEIQGLNDAAAQAPHDYHVAKKNAHSLPAGSHTGKLLHAIFEKLPFDLAKRVKSPAGFLPWICPLVQSTVLEPWQDVIADIVYQTLLTPLPGSEPAFSLSDINSKKMTREADFLFSCLTEEDLNALGVNMVRPGYIKGVIDLFFEHGGKYYLLDWKSNWLGSSSDCYQPANLLAAMQEHGYQLQAQIYRSALQRYVKLFDKRPFDEIFGGMYYVFIRGVGTNTGVLHLEGRG